RRRTAAGRCTPFELPIRVTVSSTIFTLYLLDLHESRFSSFFVCSTATHSRQDRESIETLSVRANCIELGGGVAIGGHVVIQIAPTWLNDSRFVLHTIARIRDGAPGDDHIGAGNRNRD